MKRLTRIRCWSVVAAVAAVCGLGMTGAGGAAAQPSYSYLDGLAAQLTAPGPPPGANDWKCRPDAAHPNPVVLLHGLSNDTITWNTCHRPWPTRATACSPPPTAATGSVDRRCHRYRRARQIARVHRPGTRGPPACRKSTWSGIRWAGQSGSTTSTTWTAFRRSTTTSPSPRLCTARI